MSPDPFPFSSYSTRICITSQQCLHSTPLAARDAHSRYVCYTALPSCCSVSKGTRVNVPDGCHGKSFTYESSSTIDIVDRDMDILAVLKGKFVNEDGIRDNVMIYLLEL